MGRPLADDDLLLSRMDGTRLPVRDYSREFAAQRKAAAPRASDDIRVPQLAQRDRLESRVSPPTWSPRGTATPNE